MFRLETDRLLIRPWRDDDRPRFAEIMSDTEVTRFVHRGQPYTSADVDEFLARQARQLAEHDVCMGAVEEKSTGRVVGLSGTQPLGTTGNFEIGWIFGSEVWGRGYATEAGAAAMSHVLETLAHPRVVAIIDAGNEASVRVATRLGMEYDRRYTGAELGHRKPDIVVDLFYRTR
ncbi:MAG TPA: GNAT family N-acetyltransferase [Thermoanaerobaculia bacterium]|jgi:RimJ/RimL family protein N-acetyltransferase